MGELEGKACAPPGEMIQTVKHMKFPNSVLLKFGPLYILLVPSSVVQKLRTGRFRYGRICYEG